MRKYRIVAILIELAVLSVLASVLAVPVLAEEEYQVTATLQAPIPTSSGKFGYSVAISRNIIAVGEPEAVLADKGQVGKVYIFDSDGNLLSALQSPDPSIIGQFGHSVAVSEDIIVVGEPFTIIEGTHETGKAYIFNSEGDLQATLKSPSAHVNPGDTIGGKFSYSVAINGNIIAISEPNANIEEIINAGKVHLFDLDGNLLTTLQSPEPAKGIGEDPNFGCSVAVSKSFVVVGEPMTSLDEIKLAGRAFIFDLEGNFLKTLQSPEPQTWAKFGYSVAVGEDTVVIGEYWAEAGGYSKAGRAHIFDLDGNLLTTIQSPETEENAIFGRSVSVSGNTIIIGEPSADVENINEGKVNIFDLDGNPVETLQSPTPSVGAGFGYAASTSENIVVIGEPNSVVDGKNKAGKVYIFSAGAAAFTSSGLTIDPSSVEAGGTVTVSVEVTNTGSESGTYDVTLMIDGEAKEEKAVTLNPDETETVSFEVSTSQLGTFDVEIDGLSRSYTVTEKEEKPSGGILGFPYEAIIIGVVTGVIILWILQRKR